MSRRSIVAQLWLAIVALDVVIMVAVFGSVSTVVTGFYTHMRIDELSRDGTEIIGMVDSGRLTTDAGGIVDLVAEMNGAMVMIIDRDGNILACSGGATLGEREHIAAMKDVAVALSGAESWSVARDDFLREPALSLAMPLEVSRQPAALVMLAPAGPVQQTIAAVVRVLLILAVASVAVITVLAFFLSRRLSRPLLHMAAAASEMASGNFSRRIRVSGEDEVAQLGLSMNHMSARLESTVSALAAERDRLAAAVARERQLGEVQKEFLADASHELRTPLTYLQGYTEAILDGLVAPEDERRYLQIILDECQRLRRLVTDLLDLTVIESGQVPLRPERVPVAGLIDDVAIPLKSIAATKGVTINEPAPGTVTSDVLVDPDRTKQVLVNLIDNAIRYAPPGTCVDIGVAEPDGSGKVWVAVTNNGPDIPPEAAPRVWDRFYKVDRARRRDTSGTGLGLAIARGIVEAQGGQVRVRSGFGRGTTFAFSMPVAGADHARE